jgi:serine/threonine protein kinase
MERIPGSGDLAQVLSRMRGRSEGMPLLQRRHLVRSFLEALKHIHGCRGTPAFAEGVAHMDIKPGNIVFDELMDCYVVDFDTARAIGAPVGAPRAPGVTPLYTAP